MEHKWSRREIKAAIKAAHADMADSVPDSKAREAFRTPAYQAGRLVQEQGRQMQNRTYRELLDLLLDGFGNGNMEGSQPIAEDVVEYIHGRRVDVAGYLAERFGIGGEERGQHGGLHESSCGSSRNSRKGL